jgi:hypothetical protein
MSGAETPRAMITRAGGTAGPVGLRVVDKMRPRDCGEHTFANARHESGRRPDGER